MFAIWTVVGIAAEVPSGALADRFSRRGALAASGVLQAVGFAVWILLPGFGGFAVGFVLWGLGGAFASGALEALVYDGLAAVGAEAHFAALNGRIEAVGYLVQVPTAAAATGLYALGGYALVGWVSIGFCLAAAATAMLLPEPPRGAEDEDGELSWWGTLRAGLSEAASRPGLPATLVAVAALSGIDAIDEYFPLLTADLGVATVDVPLAMVGISLAGAAGAALAGSAARLAAPALGGLLLLAAAALGVAAFVRHPGALVGVVVFYGLYRLVVVVAEARLQERIGSATRATVTSVAGFGTELSALVVVAIWPLGEVLLVAVLTAVLALVAAPALRRVRTERRIVGNPGAWTSS